MKERHISRRRDGHGAVLRMLDGATLLLTVLAALLLLCAYLSRYINPNTAWAFAFAGMAAPVLYIVNLVLALYWVVRWRWWALIPGAVLLVGIGWVSLFFKPALGLQHADPPRRAATVVSYNVAGFLSQGEKVTSTLDGVAQFVREVGPDILCLQEFTCSSASRKAETDSLMGLPHEAHIFSSPNGSGGGSGLVIYSKYKIVRSGGVEFEGSANSAMWADLVVGGDTLRVFNCHLQTTAIKRADMDYITGRGEPEQEGELRSIAGRLRRNFGIRAAQADTIAPMIRATHHRVIVCGDFNDTPMSYAYRKIRGRLADAFVESGVGPANTYKGLFNLFRIDYVLHSRKLNSVSYETPAMIYSDHKPVVVKMVL